MKAARQRYGWTGCVYCDAPFIGIGDDCGGCRLVGEDLERYARRAARQEVPMVKARARFLVLEDREHGFKRVVLKDLGPWDSHPTITNDVEAVVQQLVAEGKIRGHGEDLFHYFDSESDGTIVHVRAGEFQRFAWWDGVS